VVFKTFAESDSLSPASTNSARMAGWMAWSRKMSALQNALLKGNRVLNSKCPKLCFGGGVLKRRVVLPMQRMGSTLEQLSQMKIMSLVLLLKMILNGLQLMG
jgi:hypothetical protein